MTSIAVGLESMRTKRRPSSRHTAPSVPEPANGSRHQAPGREEAATSRRRTPIGLLGRIAGLLGAVGGNDRVKPHVGGPLAPRGLLGADQARGHVGLALHRVGVEVVRARGAHVGEDRVVLGGPAAARLGAVVIGPDDLVEERVAPEHLVEQELAVVGLAIVDVEVQRAVRGQQLPRPRQARLQEAQVVAERVVVAEALQQAGAVAAAAEAHPGGAGVGRGRHRAPRLRPAGVERRVDVDEIERARGQALEHRQVVTGDDQVVVELDP